MRAARENAVIGALKGPSTLLEVSGRTGLQAHIVLTTLSNLLAEGTVKQRGSLFWLAK